MAYNPNLLSPSEITSYQDLLQPRWRGKISMRDPRTAGAGQGVAKFMYMTPSLGPEYLKQLFAVGVVLSKDDRQVLDWIVRGDYLITLGQHDTTVVEMINKGLPLRQLSADDLAEGSFTTAGTGTLSVFTRPPHPNAVKVYLDWLLSREGQIAWSKALGYPSRRRDVPTDHLDPATLPRPGVQYQQQYKESVLPVTQEVQEFLRTILPN
jgi:ABC-type Fe3+ transport system substrate-binding protein